MEIGEFIKNPSEFTVWLEKDINDTNYGFNYCHFHPVCEIILVYTGKITIIIENQEYFAQAGDLIIIGSNERHQINIQDFPYERIGIQIGTKLLQTLLSVPETIAIFWGKEKNCHLIKLEENREFIEKIFQKIRNESILNNSFSFEYIKSLINLFTLEIYRQNNLKAPLVTDEVLNAIFKAKNYIEKNFNKGISITQLSKECFLSESYLNRKYKKMFGYSITEYIVLCRLSHSRELLLKTNKTLKSIAEECGFNNDITFIRNFKIKFGCTPGEYRKEIYSNCD